MAETIQLKLNIDGKEAQTSLQNVNKDMSALEGSLAGMTETLSGIMRELDSKLGNLSGNISTLSLAINGMDSGADKSGSGLKEWGEGIENAGSMMSNLGTALTKTSPALSAFGGALSAIGPWGMAAGSALQLLAPIFDTINERSRKAAEEGLKKLNEEILKLNDIDLNNKLKELERKLSVTELAKNTFVLSNPQNAFWSLLGADITGLESEIGAQKESIQQIKEKIELRKKDRESYLGSLEQQIQDKQYDLYKIQEDDKDAVKKIQALRSQIRELQQKIDATKYNPEAARKQQEFNAKIKASEDAYQKDLIEAQKKSELASAQLTVKHLQDKKTIYEAYGKDVKAIDAKIKEAEANVSNALEKRASGPIDMKAKPVEQHKLVPPSSIQEKEWGDPQAYAQDWQKGWADREREELDMAEAAELKKADMFANAEEMKTAIHEKYSKYRTNIDKEEAQAQMDATMGAMNFIGGAVGQNTVLGKAAAVANATMSTYEAAAKALTAGPIFGPILAGVITALGLANVSKILSIETPQMGGYAKGGIVVGEAGPEIIAPMQDYASGQALLVQQTVMEARRAMSSSQYAQASGDNQTLIRELQKLNSSFEGYSSRPITITKDAVGKIVSQGNSQLRKSRV